jgi:hypothetical protein
VKQEGSDLFIWLVTYVHGSANPVAGFLPFHCTGCYLDVLPLSSIAILNRQGIAPEDYGDALTWVAMQRHFFAGGKVQSSHDGISTMKEDLVIHSGSLRCRQVHLKGVWYSIYGKARTPDKTQLCRRIPCQRSGERAIFPSLSGNVSQPVR